MTTRNTDDVSFSEISMTLRETNLRDWLQLNGSPLPGDNFALDGENYSFIGPLGEGAFGKTFHVSRHGGGELVFKLFKDLRQAVAEEIRKEFERARSLDIPNCAKMKKLLRDEAEVIGFAYEYVEGETLETLVRTAGLRLPSVRLHQLCLDVFGALEELHKRRWVHKDIKPANIVVLPDDRGIALIDFGLLTPIGSTSRLGAGTPEYMAPEAAEANRADFQFDLYGACASLLEIIVGRATFESCFTKKNIPQVFVFLGIANDDIKDLDPRARNLARQLAKGLAIDPLKRPRSVSDMSDLINQVDTAVEPAGEEVQSSAVQGLLRLRKGSSGVLPPISDFENETQVDTQLFSELVPRLLQGEFDAVFLSGNPGDGKTTFLNSFHEQLSKMGGIVKLRTDKEWTIQHKELTFYGMLDASESDGDISSDDRIANLLTHLENPGNVVMLAINDGRIDSFMRSHSDQFDFASDVQDQLRGSTPRSPRIVVVDLKRRALVRPDRSNESGLGVQILLRLTDPQLWTECESCISREICPILDNATRIRRDSALKGIEQLLAISHYRREQRATFRDIRSVFAYVITGDRNCESVHEARQDGRDLRRAQNSQFFDLVFEASTGDHLLESWKTLDPARLPLAQAARRIISRNLTDGGLADQRSVASFAREAFFGANVALGVLDTREWNVYRYFEQYRDLLRGDSVDILEAILCGLSRILGAASPQKGKLNITMSDRAEAWKVQREFDQEDFQLFVRRVSGHFVEEAADSLVLSYQEQIEMNLSIDDVELLLRADSGEVFNDVYSMAVIAKFAGFASRLRLRETSAVSIVGPTNEIFHAHSSGTQIVMTTR